MALIKLGPVAGQVSGSIGATVFSHNRYGAYIRQRVIPTVSSTPEAIAAKNRLAAESQAWDDTTAAEKLQWRTWAQTNPIVNRLGDSQVLQPNAAYVSLNARINRAGGTRIDTPPIVDAPASLLTLAVTYDEGLGTTELAYTTTPLGATERLWVYYALMNNPGIEYFENLYKLCTVSGLAEASPYDYQADVEARFGTLIVGQRLAVKAFVIDDASGLLSGPLTANGLIITT